MPDEFVTACINKDYLTLLLPGLDVGNNDYIIILCNFGSCRIMSCIEIIYRRGASRASPWSHETKLARSESILRRP